MHRLRPVPVGLPHGTIRLTTEDGRRSRNGQEQKRLARYEYDSGRACSPAVRQRLPDGEAPSADPLLEHAVYTCEKLVKQLNKQ